MCINIVLKEKSKSDMSITPEAIQALHYVFIRFCASIFSFLHLYFSETRNLCSWQGRHCAVVRLHTVHCCVMDLQHWCHCCETEMRSDLLELWMCVYAGSVWIYFVKFSWDVTMTDGTRDAARLLLVASFLDLMKFQGGCLFCAGACVSSLVSVR